MLRFVELNYLPGKCFTTKLSLCTWSHLPVTDLFANLWLCELNESLTALMREGRPAELPDGLVIVHDSMRRNVM
jgi:hypothetical protein